MTNHSLAVHSRWVFSKECWRINRIKISFYYVTSLSCSRQKLLLIKSIWCPAQKKFKTWFKPLRAQAVLIGNYNNSQ